VALAAPFVRFCPVTLIPVSSFIGTPAVEWGGAGLPEDNHGVGKVVFYQLKLSTTPHAGLLVLIVSCLLVGFRIEMAQRATA
jgi:hypothetical protein